MPRGVYQRKKEGAEAPSVFSTPERIEPVANAALDQNTAPAPAPVKTIKMELLRNYVPRKLISIVGYLRPEKKVKSAGGQITVVQNEEWIAGEMRPHELSGVGFPNKIWAGTVIEVPEDEGRTMRANKIAEVYI